MEQEPADWRMIAHFSAWVMLGVGIWLQVSVAMDFGLVVATVNVWTFFLPFYLGLSVFLISGVVWLLRRKMGQLVVFSGCATVFQGQQILFWVTAGSGTL